jgi:HSP20 family protein
MAGLMRREPRTPETREIVDRLDHLLDEWTRVLPLRMSELLRLPLEREPALAEFVRVDEYREGEDLVVRAELPGVDPEKDIEVRVTDHRLHIEAERRQEEESERKGFVRRELRYGRFSRDLALPEGVTDEDISARYIDGILEIRVHTPEPEAATIPVTRE